MVYSTANWWQSLIKYLSATQWYLIETVESFFPANKSFLDSKWHTINDDSFWVGSTFKTAEGRLQV